MLVGFLAGPVSGGALLDAFGGPEAGASAYKPAMVSITPFRRQFSVADALFGHD